MELTEVMEWLLDKEFIEWHKDKVKFTATFYKALTGLEHGLTKQGTVLEPGRPVLRAVAPHFMVATTADFHRMTYEDWAAQFLHFINTAGVPEKIDTGRGVYQTNQATNEGIKAFRKVLETGYDYDLLRRTTQLYYESAVGFKKAIGHFFAEGHWRTHYEALRTAIADGTVTTYIKTQTKSHEHTPYVVGRRR